MEDLKVTKDKLKKVANAWAEIKSLSPNAIYDINDTTVNWNKKITFEEAKDIVTQKVQIKTPKPTAKDETKPKEPKKVSVIGILLIIYFGLTMISCSTVFFSEMNDYYWYLMLPYIFNIIAFTLLTIGICLIIYYKNSCSYNKMKSLATPKQKIKIIGIILVVFGCLCLFYHVGATASPNVSVGNINDVLPRPAGNDLGIIYLCSIPFTILLCLGVCLVFYKKISYNLRVLKYEKALNITEDNIKYNQEQLPKDIEEYENNLQGLYNEQIRLINTTHKKIGERFTKIEEIDIISVSQAKYAQQLLDYIYKGAESIKEAFKMLEADKEKQDKVMELSKSENQITIKADTSTQKLGRWKKLSKLAKAAILVPIIYFVPAIIVTILANVIKTPSMIATLMTIQLITLCFAGGIFIFEAVAIGILLYRKHKKDFEKIIKNNK